MVVTQISRSTEELGHAYVGQISLHPPEFEVQYFLCMSLIVIMWIVSGLTLRAYGDIASV